MTTTPRIETSPEDGDFHDSSLIDLEVSPQLDHIRVIVSTPDEHGIERLWMITFTGVLRFEYETVGDGEPRATRVPIEIYAIYTDASAPEHQRWVARLIEVGVPKNRAKTVWHVVLASSFARTWDETRDLEGIRIVCRDVRVDPAPRDYEGSEFHRPVIEGDTS
jgi:hypothetical protein